MTFHDPALWIAAIVPILALCALFYGIMRWVSKMDANTSATEKLTSVFQLFTTSVDGRFLDHESRISKLEGRDELRRRRKSSGELAGITASVAPAQQRRPTPSSFGRNSAASIGSPSTVRRCKLSMVYTWVLSLRTDDAGRRGQDPRTGDREP